MSQRRLRHRLGLDGEKGWAGGLHFLLLSEHGFFASLPLGSHPRGKAPVSFFVIVIVAVAMTTSPKAIEGRAVEDTALLITRITDMTPLPPRRNSEVPKKESLRPTKKLGQNTLTAKKLARRGSIAPHPKLNLAIR
mmetsp:Transcript_21689/g.32985  ORF Transcript_21689/g.32985 Transcript_21689/m.32985 type:complete len:136 (-) Transcript_21689:811-1218(-)